MPNSIRPVIQRKYCNVIGSWCRGILAFLSLALSLPSALAIAVNSPALPGQAKLEAIAESREWRGILFYRYRSWFHEDRGLFSNAGFYLSLNGRTDPLRELEATLKAFALPSTDFKPDLHPACVFPRRYKFLKEHFPEYFRGLDQSYCPHFDFWLGESNYKRAYLSFANFYPNNPASLFGHLFIRLSKKEEAHTRSALIDSAVNFSAQVPQEEENMYIKGLFGYFPGKFAIHPYYFKVQEYNHFESRDLWEYELLLSPKEIEQMLLSLWEAGPQFADYYFFDDNCAYAVAVLIDASTERPLIHGQLPPWVTPSQVLRTIAGQRDLVGEVRTRASARTRYEKRFDLLVGDEQRDFHSWRKDRTRTQNLGFKALDTALEYLELAYARDKYDPDMKPAYLKERQALLMQRAQIGEKSTELGDQSRFLDPLKGPQEARYSLVAKFPRGFWTLGLDYDPVLIKSWSKVGGDSMSISVGSMGAGFDLKRKRPFIDHFEVLSIESMAPWNRGLRPVSYRFEFGYSHWGKCFSGAPEGYCQELRAMLSLGPVQQSSLGVFGEWAAVKFGLAHSDGALRPFAKVGPEFIHRLEGGGDFELIHKAGYGIEWRTGSLPGRIWSLEQSLRFKNFRIYRHWDLNLEAKKAKKVELLAGEFSISF